MSDLSEEFRKKVGEIYSRMRSNIKQLLTETRDKGDLSSAVNLESTAQFILNSWEGAIMHMKLAKSSEPLKVFKMIIFDQILNR